MANPFHIGGTGALIVSYVNGCPRSGQDCFWSSGEFGDLGELTNLVVWIWIDWL